MVDEDSVKKNRDGLIEFVATVFDSLSSVVTETVSSSRDFRVNPQSSYTIDYVN